MQCTYFDSGVCHSCTRMGETYGEQVARKAERVAAVLDEWPTLTWDAPCESSESGFRNKAKLMVGGTGEHPTLGILDSRGHGVDLRRCGLYEPGLAASFPVLSQYVTRAGLIPFSVPTGVGELKNIIATISPTGELMVRFVLRSTEAQARIVKHLPWLREQLPHLRVCTLNILPERKAVPEGDREIVLTPSDFLPMTLDSGITLNLRPQSFFQTNTTVATELYREAARWVTKAVGGGASRVLDLFCGVGGFALHCAGPGRSITGVEISEQAIASAQLSAREAGIDARFTVGDATAATADADVVIVNPPRRGIGSLAGTLDASSVEYVLYSSCHPVSLARDLRAMPHFEPLRGRIFDMFPQTDHVETLVLAKRRG